MSLGLEPEQFAVLVSAFEPLIFVSALAFLLGTISALLIVRHFRIVRIGMESSVESILFDCKNGRRERALEHARTTRGLFGPLLEAILCGQLNARDADSASRIIAHWVNSDLMPYRSRIGLLAFIAHHAPQLGLLGALLCTADGLRRLHFAGAALDIGTLAGAIWLVLIATILAVIVAIPAFLAHNWLKDRIECHAQMINGFLIAHRGKRADEPAGCGD